MIRVYSTETGELVYQMKKHTDWIYSVEFSPDGILLATADRSAGLFVWEADAGREYQNLTGHTGSITDVSWRSDSNLLASCSEDGSIRLWEMENGKQIRTWAANGGYGMPNDASREEQIRVAERVLAKQGLGAWPSCGSKGGSLFAAPSTGGTTSLSTATGGLPSSTAVNGDGHAWYPGKYLLQAVRGMLNQMSPVA